MRHLDTNVVIAYLNGNRTVATQLKAYQLIHQPTVETRNRKPMRPNPIAPWELCMGDLRVYYEAAEEPEPVVYIRAVGIKEHNQVRIGRKVIEL